TTTLNYQTAEDQLTIEPMSISGEALRVAGSLHAARATTAPQVVAELDVNASAQQTASWLAPWLGPGVSLQGIGPTHVRAEGVLPYGRAGKSTSLPSSASTTSARRVGAAPAPLPDWTQQWQLQANTSVQGANLYGLPLGPMNAAVAWNEGQLTFDPIETAAGGGSIRLAPRLIVMPAPAMLTLPAGEVASRVEISQHVSEEMLKYAAPVLAGAARAEGTFSATIDRLQLPLEDRRRIEMGGKLVIHRLNVTPGPMLQQLEGVIQQIDALTLGRTGGPAPNSRMTLTALDKTVEFRATEGRVYHRGLEFLLDDVPISSHGSVGFDDTLAIVIEVPIQEKWIRRQRALQSLAGQKLEIPIRGTFDRPELDPQAVANMSRLLLEGAAQQYIGDEIQRALDKLFKPR
ncbi:MAG: hypothetical protein KDA61_22310, partial [Planctomycetales bacterium]|nr:hypothetical protein [Planctomycetales bacterium]